MDTYFEVRFSDMEGRNRVWRAIAEDIGRYIRKPGTILDCGTGYGSFINNIRASKKIAIDISPESKKHVQKNVEFHIASITKIPLKPSSVDVIFASNLMEHLTSEEVDEALAEAMRVLRPGGRLILLQPNWRYSYREYYDDYTHKSVFSDVSIADRLAAGRFDIICVKKKYLPMTMKSRLPKSYWLTKFYLASPVKPKAGQMLVVAEKPKRNQKSGD